MLKSSIAVVVGVFGLFAALDYSTALPKVHVSSSTGNCVGVTTYQSFFFDSQGNEYGIYSCENMPIKYHHEYAE